MDSNKDIASAEAPFYIHVEAIPVIVDSGGKFPETEIVSSLESPIKTKDIIIRFEGTDSQGRSIRRFKWRLDGGQWTETNETSVTFPNLSNGRHLFEVKAIDIDGNEDLIPAEVPFEVFIEEQFPDTRITDYPKDLVKTPYLTFKFFASSAASSKLISLV